MAVSEWDVAAAHMLICPEVEGWGPGSQRYALQKSQLSGAN